MGLSETLSSQPGANCGFGVEEAGIVTSGRGAKSSDRLVDGVFDVSPRDDFGVFEDASCTKKL
jgi:hypothetical protein